MYLDKDDKWAECQSQTKEASQRVRTERIKLDIRREFC